MGHFPDCCPVDNVEEGVTHHTIAEEEEVENDETSYMVIEDEETAPNKTEAETNGDQDKDFPSSEWANMTRNWGDLDFERDSNNSLIVSLQLMINSKKELKYKHTNLLLDTGYTMSIFNNNKMLLNVKKSTKMLRAYSNGGYQDTSYEGDFPGMFKVWYNPDSIMNILLFKDVRSHFCITMDTEVENVIKVHLKYGKVLRF